MTTNNAVQTDEIGAWSLEVDDRILLDGEILTVVYRIKRQGASAYHIRFDNGTGRIFRGLDTIHLVRETR